MILIGGHILSYKKFLLLILIILSLLCSIATVSAENSGIADDSRDIPVIDHNTQPSNYIEETGDLSIDDSSSSEGNSNSVSTNQSTPIVSNNSTLASKKAPRVWINKMIIKSKKTVIKLKSDKKGIIYYTTDGKNPTLNSKKFKNNITLSSNKVLKYFILANDGTKSKIFTYKGF